MSMPFAHFQVPASGGPIEENLNQFLTRHRVLKIEKQFLAEGTNGFWVYCVEYSSGGGGKEKQSVIDSPGRKMVDYKEILSPLDFTLFLKLKDWRKERAEADGIEASYTIFTNAQLAEIAQTRSKTKTALGKIPGVGEKRLENYGDDILKIIKKEKDDATGSKPVE